MSEIQAYHLALSEVKSKLINDEYCLTCHNYNHTNECCKSEMNGKLECDSDSMERAIIRMIEEMKK